MPPKAPTIPAPEVRRPVSPRTKFLAWLGITGVAEFILALIALHATSMTNQPWHMSDFARSRYPWLWVAGAYSFAVAGIALIFALQEHLPGSVPARAGLVLLWLSVFGMLLIATFPSDLTPQPQTVSGTIHNDAVWPTFSSVGVAMMVMGPALHRRRSWRPFAAASVVLGLLVCASGIAYVLADTRGLILVAFAQRLLVALIAIWFVLLGLNLLAIRPLRSREAPAATQPALQAVNAPAPPQPAPDDHP
ncbi:MAG: DUF998 domain-containing protein [bacterium]